jgi:RNA polymerase sigma-70 factor, ECF subfamily
VNDPDGLDIERAFQELRPLMFSIAYRMTGSVSEAEDIVQEAFVHLQGAAGEEIKSPRAYVATITTRLAIDYLRSARVKREQYVGSWLPEPLVADAPGPGDVAETADSLSLSFLVLLESLTPVERAVFLLREVFGYDYQLVAEVVNRSEENCRQILSRARGHLEARKPRFETSYQQREKLTREFLAACEQGDTAQLIDLLAADVAMYGDGGGKAPAIPAPIFGRERVSRVVLALTAQARQLGLRPRLVDVNGQPGAVFVDLQARLVNVVSLDIVHGQIQTVRSIVNPDKLRHLGPVADVKELLRGRHRAGGAHQPGSASGS